MDILEKLLPTFLIVITGLITWLLKDKSEKLKFQIEKLIEEKRLNYEKVLEPIIRIFAGAKNKKEKTPSAKFSDKAIASFPKLIWLHFASTKVHFPKPHTTHTQIINPN